VAGALGKELGEGWRGSDLEIIKCRVFKDS
jgi:hypothetical protein